MTPSIVARAPSSTGMGRRQRRQRGAAEAGRGAWCRRRRLAASTGLRRKVRSCRVPIRSQRARPGRRLDQRPGGGRAPRPAAPHRLRPDRPGRAPGGGHRAGSSAKGATVRAAAPASRGRLPSSGAGQARRTESPVPSGGRAVPLAGALIPSSWRCGCRFERLPSSAFGATGTRVVACARFERVTSTAQTGGAPFWAPSPPGIAGLTALLQGHGELAAQLATGISPRRREGRDYGRLSDEPCRHSTHPSSARMRYLRRSRFSGCGGSVGQTRGSDPLTGSVAGGLDQGGNTMGPDHASLRLTGRDVVAGAIHCGCKPHFVQT